MTYGDMTFCSRMECRTATCRRHSDRVPDDAKMVAWSDFYRGCDHYSANDARGRRWLRPRELGHHRPVTLWLSKIFLRPRAIAPVKR